MTKEQAIRWIDSADDDELLDAYVQYEEITIDNIQGYVEDWGMSADDLLDTRMLLRNEVLWRMGLAK